MRYVSPLIICLWAFYTNILTAGEHWDAEQVARYAKNSEVQRRSAEHLIFHDKVAIARDSTILDIGCGNGRTTALLSLVTSQGFTLGIDPNPHMIQWAKDQHTTRDYPKLGFQEGSYETIEKIPGEFSVITGFLSFHLVSPELRDKVIENIYKKLDDNGLLLMVIPPSPKENLPWMTAMAHVLKSKEWQKYFPQDDKRFHWEDAETLRARFKRVFGDHVTVEFKGSDDPFVHQNDFIHWILGTMPFVQKVPDDHKEKLAKAIINEYVRRDPRVKNHNTYHGNWGRIEVIGYKRK